jgi:hypothetical protein
MWRRPIPGFAPRRRPSIVCALAMAALSAGALSAQEMNRPQLHPHENYIEEVRRAAPLALNDPMAVFGFVFDSLPERVKVYPTENYYYFTFIHLGVSFDGNIRLDASDRDDGKLHFAYSETMSAWRDETPVNYLRLDASNGVIVDKVDRLTYRVRYRQKHVVFALNDLSRMQPPAASLTSDEKFVGPVFDESGIAFFLAYNSKLKAFHYILDESAKVPDAFLPDRRTDRILVGKRTGFAFYRDHRVERKILIGVFEGNARLNNYFDGPFDQLPDNFIEGDTLQQMILEVDPGLKGRIDRFGSSLDGDYRFMIAPYLYYRTPDELLVFHKCATDKRVPTALYHACFVIDDQETGARPEPMAWKKAKQAGPNSLSKRPKRR